MNRILIITRFDIDDTECNGDYREVDIFVDNKRVVTYGDWYHDKGEEKSQGFVDACKYLFPKVIVEKKNVSDWNL